MVEFHTEGGVVRAVNGVSFAIPSGGTLALIGESGCGKSVTSLALLNLVRPPGRITGGTITYTGRRRPGAGDHRLEAELASACEDFAAPTWR